MAALSDIKLPEGKEIIMRLTQTVDVLVENFRPGVMERLGLGYEDLCSLNPRLIYASVSGFGQTGPYLERMGQDAVAQALSGLMAINGTREGPPIPVAVPVADFTAGMMLCQGILMALLDRVRTGQGQWIETNLLDSGLLPQIQDFLTYMNTGEMGVRGPQGGIRPFSLPTTGVYRAKDGYMTLNTVFLRGNPVSLMSSMLGLPDLGADPRFDTPDKARQSWDELRDIFGAEFVKKRVAEWVDLFKKEGVLCAPVQEYEEVCNDPQILHNQMIVEMDHPRGGKIKALGNPLKMHRTPWKLRLGPPDLGSHTDEVLDGLGYLPEQIAVLREKRIVG